MGKLSVNRARNIRVNFMLVLRIAKIGWPSFVRKMTLLESELQRCEERISLPSGTAK